MPKIITLIIPCFNEQKNITLLVEEIKKYIPNKYNYEIIFVDDGSEDNTSNVISKLCKQNKRIKAIFMRRRFGQQAALMAGIKYAKRDAAITMDADFQHPPQTIPKLIEYWEKGYDLVMCKKDGNRQKVKGGIRYIGYYIWKWVTEGLLTPGVSEFMLMDKEILNIVSKSKEKESFLRGLATMSARNSILIPYKIGKRKFGKSSYGLIDIYNVFINGFISFSTKPLRITAFLGLFIFISSFAFLIIDALYALFLHRRIASGYLTIVFLIALFNGFIVFYLGILGEYIGVIFREVKKRPSYMIDHTVNI